MFALLNLKSCQPKTGSNGKQNTQFKNLLAVQPRQAELTTTPFDVQQCPISPHNTKPRLPYKLFHTAYTAVPGRVTD